MCAYTMSFQSFHSGVPSGIRSYPAWPAFTNKFDATRKVTPMSTNPYRRVLEAYLERKKASGEPLPGIRGRVNYKGLPSKRAFLPTSSG